MDNRGGGLEDWELEPESSLQQQNRPKPPMELRLAPSRFTAGIYLTSPLHMALNFKMR